MTYIKGAAGKGGKEWRWRRRGALHLLGRHAGVVVVAGYGGGDARLRHGGAQLAAVTHRRRVLWQA